MRKEIACLVPTAMLLMAAGSPPAHAVAVVLDNFKFAPEAVHVPGSTEIVLTLRNDGSGGHNFAAPEFFAASKIDPADKAKVKGGRVEVAKSETVAIHLTTPASGQYALKCTHFLHAGFGMKGSIVVDPAPPSGE